MNPKKIKIFIFGRDKVNWSIDKDRETITFFLKKNNFKITKNIFKSTHVFCVWADLLLSSYYWWLLMIKIIFKFKIIAVITNDISFYPQKLNRLKKYVDIFIAPSSKIYDLLNANGLKVCKIPFFVNPNIFKPLNLKKEEICKRLDIKWNLLKDKIIIGSFQRDSLGTNLLKPKWQKNPDLLIKILEKLPKEKTIFLLAGPRRHYIIDRCIEKKINFLFYGDYSYIKNKKDDISVNNLLPQKINLLYNLIDLYIVSSKSEGGPKQILESALTKTLIFSTNVGLAPDFLHPNLIFNKENLNELIEKIYQFIKSPKSFTNYLDYNYQKTISEMNEDLLIKKYRNVISENL